MNNESVLCETRVALTVCIRLMLQPLIESVADLNSSNRSKTHEIKRTLFNKKKQGKTCKFSRYSSFSSYVQYNRKQFNQLIFVR